ncbi:hypothetical protein OsJ_29089 [Oryza sativa Japonica Group]|uniref:Uncharacterized protein n=1 Tax=Oryza sativa subsp. japonica TaxID=39947 RepID=A3BY33_ORYSJ|nr:hypothetical protein OsJ_29089 [Oryza sativa Japonica Group]
MARKFEGSVVTVRHDALVRFLDLLAVAGAAATAAPAPSTPPPPPRESNSSSPPLDDWRLPPILPESITPTGATPPTTT